MRIYSIILLLITFFTVLYPPVGVNAYELTEDNPNTLIGTTSSNYTIFGLHLGITQMKAWQIIQKTQLLTGEKDVFNPSRIYVYFREDDGSKGDCLLNLVWKPENRKLRSIVVFQDFRIYLSPNFQRLLSLEALDTQSEFIKRFRFAFGDGPC